MNNSIWFKILIGAALALAIATDTGCGTSASSFSILPAGQSFQQNGTAVNSKIDILWVIDNSGSMQTSQNNLASNFPSFIQGFASRGLDFQMGVIATDTYFAFPFMSAVWSSYNYLGRPQADWAYLRDGGYFSGTNVHSGYFILNPSTPNLNNVFVTNVTQGTQGSGDERPLQSMQAALESPLNAGLVRADSYLAVISITDEDDFSNNSSTYLDNDYNNPGLISIPDFVHVMETATGTTLSQHRFAYHSIAVQDQACLTKLGSGRNIGIRVNAMADATGGTKSSICGDFATQLELIANNIIELAHQFYLNKVPVVSTITVSINGVQVPNVANNPGPLTGGWLYNASANSIVFQGDYIPPAGASIFVGFDPVNLGP